MAREVPDRALQARVVSSSWTDSWTETLHCGQGTCRLDGCSRRQSAWSPARPSLAPSAPPASGRTSVADDASQSPLRRSALNASSRGRPVRSPRMPTPLPPATRLALAVLVDGNRDRRPLPDISSPSCADLRPGRESSVARCVGCEIVATLWPRQPTPVRSS